MTEREAFEAWASSIGSIEILPSTSEFSGDYKSIVTQVRWGAWQAATAAKDAEIAALKAERDRYRQALEAMTKKEPCDCGCPSGESVVILKPTHYYAIASDALKGDAAIAKAEGIVK